MKRSNREPYVIYVKHWFNLRVVIRFFSSNVVMGASHSMGSFCLCSYIQGEGNTAQVAVSGRIIDDALAIEFALYLDVSVVLHS